MTYWRTPETAAGPLAAVIFRGTEMRRRDLFAVGLALAAGATAARATVTDPLVVSLIDDLKRQGYKDFDVSQTWLGRVRIVARMNGVVRELIIDPRTGEILRDYQDVQGQGGRPRSPPDPVDHNGDDGGDGDNGDPDSHGGNGQGSGDSSSNSGSDGQGSGEDGSGQGSNDGTNG